MFSLRKSPFCFFVISSLTILFFFLPLCKIGFTLNPYISPSPYGEGSSKTVKFLVTTTISVELGRLQFTTVVLNTVLQSV